MWWIAIFAMPLSRLRPVPKNQRCISSKRLAWMLSRAVAQCHSLDYVIINSPFLSNEKWDATITKMIKAFGAPIDPADTKTIGDYLKQNYGG